MNQIETEAKVYREAGKEYARVTALLKSVGLIPEIPFLAPDELDWYLERGQKAHQACELWDLGDLDEESLDPELRPRLEAYKSFRRDTGFVPTDIEKYVKHDAYGIAGRLDRKGFFAADPGRKAIVDLKMTEVKPWTAIQLALYAICEDQDDGFYGHDRYGLALRKDGTYRLTKFTDRKDKAVAEAAITLFHFMTKGE